MLTIVFWSCIALVTIFLSAIVRLIYLYNTSTPKTAWERTNAEMTLALCVLGYLFFCVPPSVFISIEGHKYFAEIDEPTYEIIEAFVKQRPEQKAAIEKEFDEGYITIYEYNNFIKPRIIQNKLRTTLDAVPELTP